MSSKPVDKRRARQTKRPWYLTATTFRVVALLVRMVVKVIDLID